MNNTDYIERKLQRVIYTFIVAVIIIVAAFAATIYYYETKEISRAVVGEGLFVKAFVDNSVGTAPLAVNFSSLLFNFEGTPTYHWDFGDGNTSNATSPAYTYNKPGEYTCNLTVIDIDGKNVTTSFRILVSVNQPPTVVALVTPTTSPRPSKGALWLIQLLKLTFSIGEILHKAILESNSSVTKKEGWITCEAQVSDPEGDEIVNYKWELTLPAIYYMSGTVEWPKYTFEGKDLKTITFPMIYTFRNGQYDVRVNVTDSAGNTRGDIKRFNVEKSNLEGTIGVMKLIWNNMWGPNFDYQTEPAQKILIKIWTVLGPAQTAMNNMVKRILAPLPPDLRDTIYSLYYTLIWDAKDTQYHKPNFNAPAIPSDPTPANNDTSISLDTNLSWSCSDTDGDRLSYDIYFGTFSPPPLVKAGYDKTTFELGGALIPGTTYYWKIVVRDHPKASAYGGSKTVEGPIWKFTTV